MSYMSGSMELIRSCCAMLDLLRFYCHKLTVVRLWFVVLFIGRGGGQVERFCHCIV